MQNLQANIENCANFFARSCTKTVKDRDDIKAKKKELWWSRRSCGGLEGVVAWSRRSCGGLEGVVVV